jgi:hypothetical protein
MYMKYNMNDCFYDSIEDLIIIIFNLGILFEDLI